MPPAERKLSTLARVDYEDAFLVETGPTENRTAEQWARAILEDAPIATRKSLQPGWFTLGLRLSGASSERSVLGWELRGSTPDLCSSAPTAASDCWASCCLRAAIRSCSSRPSCNTTTLPHAPCGPG